MNFNERSHQHQHCDEGRHELSVRRYVDAGVVAQTLDVSRDSVYRWAREGSMDGAYRFNGLWRFHAAEVVDWAEKCRQRRRSPR